MSEDVLAGLSRSELQELAGSLKGPDLSSLLKAEYVFTDFIRYLVEGSEAMGACRHRLLTADDIVALYEELKKRVVTISEAEEKQLARWVCEACRGFFSRVRNGLYILSRNRSLPSPEARFEVFALWELAGILGNHFENYAAAGRVGEAVLRDVILEWAHKKYPNWGLTLDGKRWGE